MKRKRTTRVVIADDGNGGAARRLPRSRTRWRRVDALTDEDVRRAAAADPDTRILTVRELAVSYRVPEAVDVQALRRKMRMSQGAFARKYGFSVDAVQDWEQGRVRPSQSARVLLTVIAREPEAVDRALRHEVQPDERDARSRRRRP